MHGVACGGVLHAGGERPQRKRLAAWIGVIAAHRIHMPVLAV